MLSRRSVLTGSAALVAAMGLPFSRLVRADAGKPDLKFVFVFAPGGWDPTRVLAPVFDNPNVDLEAGAERGVAGNLDFVDHPDRPSVRAFFEAQHARTAVFRGMLVRSIAHEICTMIAMTGTSDGQHADWPAILANAERDRFTLPHLVVDGPSFPGDLGVAVARSGTNGQLASLLDGSAVDRSATPVKSLKRPSEDVLDRYLVRRAAARADASKSSAERALTTAYATSLSQATSLESLQYVMDFSASAALEDQADLAVALLANRVSRCVTLAYATGSWDTHTNNDVGQSPLWDATFAGLTHLMLALDATPGETAATLADETCVVVLSEMGRTPMLNAAQGKDHWPYTCAMLIGAGFRGDRVVGAYDDSYYGRTVDPSSGDVADGAQVLSAEALGATLLAMADVDPGAYVSGVSPIEGLLT